MTTVHEDEARQLVAALDVPFGPNLGTADELYNGLPNDLPGWRRVGRHRPARDGYYPDHSETEYRAPSGAVYTVRDHDPQRNLKVAGHVRVVTVLDGHGSKVDVTWSPVDVELAAVFRETEPPAWRILGADRRALAVLKAVEQYGRGGRGLVARTLGVSVGQVDQYLARARKTRPEASATPAD